MKSFQCNIAPPPSPQKKEKERIEYIIKMPPGHEDKLLSLLGVKSP